MIVPAPVALAFVRVDPHDAPLVPIWRAEVRNSRCRPVGQSADSINERLAGSVNWAIAKPSFLVERERVPHGSVRTYPNNNGRLYDGLDRGYEYNAMSMG